MINSWNPFNAVLLPIYKHADLKVIKRIEKLREESLV